MQPNTLERREYKVKMYVRNLAKIHVGSETGSGSETNWKVGSGYWAVKNLSESTTLASWTCYYLYFKILPVLYLPVCSCYVHGRSDNMGSVYMYSIWSCYRPVFRAVTLDWTCLYVQLLPLPVLYVPTCIRYRMHLAPALFLPVYVYVAASCVF